MWEIWNFSLYWNLKIRSSWEKYFNSFYQDDRHFALSLYWKWRFSQINYAKFSDKQAFEKDTYRPLFHRYGRGVVSVTETPLERDPPDRDPLDRDPPTLWTEKCFWKHYLPTTSFAGCKNQFQSKWFGFSGSKNFYRRGKWLTWAGGGPTPMHFF